jgi:hypothetical protein
LPKNLAEALQWLSDAEVDALLAAVTAEARRRRRLATTLCQSGPTGEARSWPRRAPADDGAGSLTTGKLNAVRAAFKAGVRPAAIARQFGISQSDLKKALEKLSR